MKTRLILMLCFACSLAVLWSQRPAESLEERFQRMSERANLRGLAEPFKGVTTNGAVRTGLFRIESTGISTEPVRQTAKAFLDALTPEQREKTVFPVDDPEWRKWMNQHFYVRQGVGFNEMNHRQREAAFALFEASLSAEGVKLTRDIMRLNHSLGEIANNFEELGEWLYWITVMGEPSADQPWGWQLDGHHVIINYFVLGDQVVMTPLFVGSEPAVAEAGKYKGVAVLQREQAKGLEFVNRLNDSQRDKAILDLSKTGNNNVSEAFKDNVVLNYAGVPVAELSAGQKDELIKLIGLYVGTMAEGHGKVRMEEVKKHLEETYFAWIGETGPEAVFYYRIHSPVILIEFDHQGPVFLPRTAGRRPIRQHIHAVVRTPNGNDYGKDLLRQHYERSHKAD